MRRLHRVVGQSLLCEFIQLCVLKLDTRVIHRHHKSICTDPGGTKATGHKDLNDHSYSLLRQQISIYGDGAAFAAAVQFPLRMRGKFEQLSPSTLPKTLQLALGFRRERTIDWESRHGHVRPNAAAVPRARVPRPSRVDTSGLLVFIAAAPPVLGAMELPYRDRMIDPLFLIAILAVCFI